MFAATVIQLVLTTVLTCDDLLPYVLQAACASVASVGAVLEGSLQDLCLPRRGTWAGAQHLHPPLCLHDVLRPHRNASACA